MSRRARFACLAGGAVALIAANGGITYALTAASSAPTNDYAIGCSSTHHALRLINSDGSCPTGYSRINVAAAPSTLVTVSTSGSAAKTATVAGFEFASSCTPGSVSRLDVRRTGAAEVYDLRGTVLTTGYGFDYSYGHNGAGIGAFDPGSDLVSLTEPAADPVISFQLYSDEATMDFVVARRSGHTITAHVYLQLSGGSCFIEAQIQPGT